MSTKKDRADVAAPTRPAEEKPSLQVHINPQAQFNTAAPSGQVKNQGFREETEIIQGLIKRYDNPYLRKLPEKSRRYLYEEGKRRFFDLCLSNRAYEYGIATLAGYLRL